ncbi:unnamed protein product [Victoria cruziana]
MKSIMEELVVCSGEVVQQENTLREVGGICGQRAAAGGMEVSDCHLFQTQTLQLPYISSSSLLLRCHSFPSKLCNCYLYKKREQWRNPTDQHRGQFWSAVRTHRFVGSCREAL